MQLVFYTQMSFNVVETRWDLLIEWKSINDYQTSIFFNLSQKKQCTIIFDAENTRNHIKAFELSNKSYSVRMIAFLKRILLGMRMFALGISTT